MQKATAIEFVTFGISTGIEYRVCGKNAKQALSAGKNEVKRRFYITHNLKEHYRTTADVKVNII